eukprot:PLAT2943.1.p2 GENE.PLAT2943.1~~PLAT2943.1.p2  ORF type:complete len:128 (-),score=19.05 PLAT2943.1:103-432(-)
MMRSAVRPLLSASPVLGASTRQGVSAVVKRHKSVYGTKVYKDAAVESWGNARDHTYREFKYDGKTVRSLIFHVGIVPALLIWGCRLQQTCEDEERFGAGNARPCPELLP